MTQSWYPFYWSDYSGKTLHLTQGQHGAYMLLLRWIYTTGKPIPHKQRYSIARASLEQEQADTDAVLGEFFTRLGDEWANAKAEQVMAQANEKHKKRVESGAKGGAAKASNARAMPEQKPSNALLTTTTTTVRERGKPLSSYPGGFDEFWGVYPKHNGSKKEAAVAYQRAITKGIAHEVILAGARRYAAYIASRADGRQYTKHATSWLNGQFWEADWEPEHQLRPGNPAMGDRRDPATRARDEAERINAERRARWAAEDAAQARQGGTGGAHAAALPDLRQPKDLRGQGGNDGLPRQHVPAYPG